MASYPPDSLVEVLPFAHNREGDDVIIGDTQRQVFLCIPADGLDILESLAAGNTVGETARVYQKKYAETPDIEDFLQVLSGEGFVRPAGGPDAAGPATGDAAGPARTDTHHRAGHGWSLNWISPAVARRLCSLPILIACGLISAVGVFLIARDPDLIPSSAVLLFPRGHFTALTLAVMAIAIVALIVHELAHAVVARAVGAPTRLGIGNLMYVMVAQTDISAMWMAPKRKRYLAFVAGTMVDGVFVAIIIALLSADRHGWITLNPTVAEPLLSACLLTNLARIAFQFFFYIRTDVYYIFATATNTKNLMADTETLLRNAIARVFGRRSYLVDQSGIPRKERRVIRWYAVMYVLGRFFAFGVLFFYYLPLLWGYIWQFALLATGHPHHFTLVDFVTAAVLTFLIDGAGLILWMRSLYRDGRARGIERSKAQAAQSTRRAADTEALLHSPV